MSKSTVITSCRIDVTGLEEGRLQARWASSQARKKQGTCDHHVCEKAGVAGVTSMTSGNADMQESVVNFNRSERKLLFFTLIRAVKS